LAIIIFAIGPDLVHDSGVNPEFLPDDQLYAEWRNHAEFQGLRLKIGRWNILGSPIAILVDFSDFLSKKNEIFGELWDGYRLDSLSGQWDYIEPALFGYATGKIIENFVLFNLLNLKGCGSFS
jgi:phosphorylase/glycogen(starch) synthase